MGLVAAAAAGIGQALPGVGSILGGQSAGQLLTGLAVDASVASGVIGAVSAIQQSKDIASAQRDRAAIQSEMIRRDRQRRLGTLRAQIGASGAQLSGTPLNVLAEQSGQAEYDRMLALSSGEQASHATLSQGRSAAINAGMGGLSGALRAGTILSGFEEFGETKGRSN